MNESIEKRRLRAQWKRLAEYHSDAPSPARGRRGLDFAEDLAKARVTFGTGRHVDDRARTGFEHLKSLRPGYERAFAPCVGCTTPNCCAALGECMREYDGQERHRELCDEYVHGKGFTMREPIPGEFDEADYLDELDVHFPAPTDALGLDRMFTFDWADVTAEKIEPVVIEPNVGGTCQLKSGGQVMTIAGVEKTLRLDATNDGNGKNRVTNLGCVWTDANGVIRTQQLSLMLVDVLS